MPNPEKQNELFQRMAELNIREADLEEVFQRSGGPGGQKINKTSVAVRLTHIPSGISVVCSEQRSQTMNRFFARRRLLDKLEEKILGEKSKVQQAQEKIRRQKRRRSRKAKQKILETKRHRSGIKRLRQKPDME